MNIDGSCHCGQITFEAEIDPDRVRICNCTDCQVMPGSAFNAKPIFMPLQWRQIWHQSAPSWLDNLSNIPAIETQ